MEWVGSALVARDDRYLIEGKPGRMRAVNPSARKATIHKPEFRSVAFGVVVQNMVGVLEVELERGLGNVQADIDGRFGFVHGVQYVVYGVRSLTCSFERVAPVGAAAPSTVRVRTQRHERLQLRNERVETVRVDNERARAVARPPRACSQFRSSGK